MPYAEAVPDYQQEHLETLFKWLKIKGNESSALIDLLNKDPLGSIQLTETEIQTRKTQYKADKKAGKLDPWDQASTENELNDPTWLLEKYALSEEEISVREVEKENIDALKKHMMTIYQIIEQLKKDQHYSGSDLSAWWETVGRRSASEVNEDGLNSNTTYASANSGVNYLMIGTYVLLNILSLVLASLAYCHIDAQFLASAVGTSSLASGWNYIDVFGGLVQSGHEFANGNYAMGSGLMLSSCQLMGSTLAANIGVAVGSVSVTAASGLLGFSFAVCMWLACGLEMGQVFRANQRAADFKKEKDSLKALLTQHELRVTHQWTDEALIHHYGDDVKLEAYLKGENPTLDARQEDDTGESSRRQSSGDEGAEEIIDTKRAEAIRARINAAIPELKNKIKLLDQSIMHEKAKAADHKRAAYSWAACAVGMTAVAVVAYIVASGATMGMLPALTVAVAVVAVLTAGIRGLIVSLVNYEKNLRNSFDKRLDERLDKLKKVTFTSSEGGKLELDLDNEVTFKTYKLFDNTLSLRGYIKDLMHKDPDKAARLIDVLEKPPVNPAEFEPLLDKKRDLDVGKTRGRRLFETLYDTATKTASEVDTLDPDTKGYISFPSPPADK